jgi:hypothetical protein
MDSMTTAVMTGRRMKIEEKLKAFRMRKSGPAPAHGAGNRPKGRD